MASAIQTALHCEVEITTGKFTTTAEGFDMRITKTAPEKVANYFEQQKIEYAGDTNTNLYTIIYPDSLSAEVIDPKDLQKVLEKEREKMMRRLKNNNLNYLGKGKAKTGCYTTSRMSEMVKTSSVVFSVKNETAAKQINVTLHKMYKEAADGSVKITIEGTIVRVQFLENFFKKADQSPEPSENTTVPHTDTRENNALEIEQKQRTQATSDAAAALEIVQDLRKNVFGLFSPEIKTALEAILTDGKFKVVQEYHEGPEENRAQITRTLTKADIVTLIIEPFIAKMKI